MKKLRSTASILLAAILLTVLGACTSKSSGVSVPYISMPPMDVSAQSQPSGNDTQNDAPEAAPSAETGTTVCSPSVVIGNTAHLDGHPKAIQEGSVLSYAVKNDVTSCLPWNATSEIWLLRNIYESLLMANLNDPEDINGCIAQSWSHSDDFMSWTFVIREGISFTDGTVCDAAAIAECWNYYKEVSPSTFTNHNISSWNATGKYEFTIRMAAPCAYIETALAGTSFLIISPTALSLYGTNDDRAAVGTAPYYLAEHIPASHFTLCANTGYYLEAKQPAVETIKFYIFTDETNALIALINDEIDGATLSSTESYYNLIDSGYDGTLISTLSDTAPLWFNAKKVEAFSIFEVRKAMCRFIDFTAINDLIYSGMGDTPSSLWAAGSPGYVHSDEFYYSPEQGKKLLAGVGLAPGDISFTSTIHESGKDQFIAIQNYLDKQGIHMDVKIIDAAANFTCLQTGDWTVTIGCVGYRSSAPYLPWTYALKPDAAIKQVWSDIYDPDLYQKMLDEYDMMSTAETWDEMLEHCRMITKYLQDDFGAIPGIQKPDFLVLSSRFKNAVYYTESHALMCWYLYI